MTVKREGFGPLFLFVLNKIFMKWINLAMEKEFSICYNIKYEFMPERRELCEV